MQALDPFTIPLQGTFLIEAGAGTGKTYTLTLLYLRLILERQLKVDEILVVTFTRAATDELRTRIRGRLKQTLAALEDNGEVEQDVASLLHNIDPEQAGRDLRDAMAQMDEAAVFTIHGFCRRLLEDNAFETGIPFEAEFLESEEQLRLLVMEDFWRKRFYPLSKEMSAWVAANWENPEALLNSLRSALAVHGAEVVPEIAEDDLQTGEERCRRLLEDAKVLWRSKREEITHILSSDPCLTRNQKSYRLKDKVPELIEAMDVLADHDGLPYNAPKILALLTQTSLDNNLKKKCAAPPQHPFFQQFELYYDEHEQYLRSLKISILQEALSYLKEETARRKTEVSALCFDDLLLDLSRALNRPGTGSKLAGKIRARYPAALVDEFQDTDPLQYMILNEVYGGSDKAVYMIGDPKQAIYSFRGADIFTYIKARNRTPAAQQYSLDTNYRSTAAMVDAVNRLFDRPNGFLFEPGITFHPVKAAAADDMHPFLINGVPATPLTAILIEGPEGTPKKPNARLNKADATTTAAARTAGEVARLLEQGRRGAALLDRKPVEAGDIAVLVRTHHEAEVMRGALSALGINSVYYSRESVFNTPEAGGLYTVLTALLDLADTPAVRTALATDCFGLNAERIMALHEDTDEWEQLFNTLHSYRRLWKEQGVMAMLQRLFAEQRVVQRLTAQLGGERKLTNYLHLTELLQDSKAADHGGAGLLRWFSQQRHMPQLEAEHLQVRLESDEHLVKIVTIHKSKGLEYPIVFLPFIWGARSTRAQEIQIFHDRDTMAPVIDMAGTIAEHSRLAEQEVQAEYIRLLYVAVTRARCCCYFCWGMISKIENSPLARFLHHVPEHPFPADLQEITDQLNRFNHHGPVMALAEPFAPVAGFRGDAQPPRPLTVRPFTGAVNRGRPITSYSQLTAAPDSMVHTVPAAPLTPPEVESSSLNSFTFPRGPSAGTCLHTIFERIDFSAGAEAWVPEIREALVRGGISLEWEQSVAAWIEAIVSVRLPGSCSLRDIGPAERINELAFLFPLKQKEVRRLNRTLDRWGYAPLDMAPAALEGMMKGFVDLVFRHDDRYFIADYKSNYLGHDPTHYTDEPLTRAMGAHRYDLQYLIYTTALHRYLHIRLPGYSYEKHFGGVYYLFLRGMHPHYPEGNGVFFNRPGEACIAEFDSCFRGGEA